MKLPQFSVNRPVTTLMVFLGVILVGLFTLVQTPVDMMPEMEIPVIMVTTQYEGAGPEEIEEQVTRPLERMLATVEDLDNIISVSREDSSQIRLIFNWGIDLDARANDVRDVIDRVDRFLPEDAERPQLLKFDLNQFPIIVLGVHADESYLDLERILEDDVSNHLESVSGVGAVDVSVPLQRQINVHVDREKLSSYGLTFDEVTRAIAREDYQMAAGSLKMGSFDYLPRVDGKLVSVDEMNDIVVYAQDGTVVRLEDIATVEDGFEEVDSFVRINEKRGGMMFVRKQPDANTVEVARGIHAELDRIRPQLPPDIEIINVMDSSEDIVLIVNDLVRTLFIGGLMAMLMVFIFLRQVRSTFIIALTIPFSLIASAILIYFLDYTINMLTLFALIITIGLVVDNAIVILENITRHREEGENQKEGAIYGASEVGMAIIASSLTTLCIFFPLLFVRGIARVLFIPFAAIAAVVILASLFTSLTMTPMLASRLIPANYQETVKKRGFFYRWSEKIFDKIAEIYSIILGWCLKHRWVVITGATVIFLGSVLLTPFIGWEFLPREDTAMIQGTIELPVGTRYEKTAEALEKVNEIIREEIKEEYIRGIFITTGGMGPGRGDQRSHSGRFGVRLVTQDHRDLSVFEIADILRERIDEIAPFYSIEDYRLDLQDPMAGLIGGGEQPLSIKVIGDDLDAAERYAEELRDKIAELPGAIDVRTSMEEGAPEIRVNIDRQKASSLGLNVGDIGDAIRAAVHGRTASVFHHMGEEMDIYVRLRKEDRQVAEDIGLIPVRLPTGELVRVDSLAEVTFGVGPLQIEREAQRRVVRVEGDVRDRSLGELITDVRGVIAETETPPGIMVEIGGELEEIQEAFFWLALALVIGIILVYMVMASQFESLVDPFVVMFSVPFAFIGVLWGLYLRDFSLNIIVFLGALLLIGIVVNNAIVLVDYINILRARGKTINQAICIGGRTRLRPVLMTAITTMAALIPMAFQRGQGHETWNPLGTTILGGLLVSTIVTLFIVPTMYSIFERWSPKDIKEKGAEDEACFNRL